MKLLVGLLVAKASADFEFSCWTVNNSTSEGSGDGEYIGDFFNHGDGTFTIESGLYSGECILEQMMGCDTYPVVAATEINWGLGERNNDTGHCDNTIIVDSTYCSDNISNLFQWNSFGNSIYFINEGNNWGNDTMSITFQYACYEDLVPQPDCVDLGQSLFGLVQYNVAEIGGTVSSNFIIDPNPSITNITSMSCAQQCVATAGCFGFSEDDNGCLLSSNSLNFDGASVGALTTGRWDDYCPNTHVWNYSYEGTFYCLFRTSLSQQDYVDQLNAQNPGGVRSGVRSYTSSWNGVTYASSYSYEFEYFVGEPSYADRFNYGPGYVWVGFKYNGNSRWGRVYDSTTSTITASRKRRQVQAPSEFEESFEELDNVINDIAGEIQEETATIVPNVDPDAILEETGDVETTVSQLADSGDVTGTFSSDGALVCEEGAELAEDGSCQPILITELPTNEDPLNPTEPPPTLDCDDGNNGGCSHFCNQDLNVCECPSCWVLRDDQAECTPNPEKIHISCEQSAMSLELDRCIYSSDVSDDIVLSFNDNACESNAFGTDAFAISTGLDECGTALSVDGDEIIFDNTIGVKSRTNNHGIVMNTNVNIDVQCRFSSYVNDVSSSNYTNSDATQDVGTTGTGTFQFEAAFFSDDSFDSEAGAEDEQMVGEAVFFGLSPSIPVEDLTFIVDDCFVTDGTNNTFYVYEDGCPNPVVNNNAISQSFENIDQFQLSYTAFQFSGNSEVQSMEMHCSLYVCMVGVCPVTEPTC
ncbi:Oidioi.mRNA.OKI2018_I69.PAR.g11041.t1.cds [Oikopleura dioica]|uniref:Oidioi.mRNA.OKI2018_I69.PAR.g11041.t1.cds n=1 Tax=Oikopleura dioica TaxID=34765 RepID=A0ABN7RTN8_OIKDI|nr:Oidioi.mRNA.OKI2018_I69.PAR.g11041.t1.cds [Oikopleura dioica]